MKNQRIKLPQIKKTKLITSRYKMGKMVKEKINKRTDEPTGKLRHHF